VNENLKVMAICCTAAVYKEQKGLVIHTAPGFSGQAFELHYTSVQASWRYSLELLDVKRGPE